MNRTLYVCSGHGDGKLRMPSPLSSLQVVSGANL